MEAFVQIEISQGKFGKQALWLLAAWYLLTSTIFPPEGLCWLLAYYRNVFLCQDKWLHTSKPVMQAPSVVFNP